MSDKTTKVRIEFETDAAKAASDVKAVDSAFASLEKRLSKVTFGTSAGEAGKGLVQQANAVRVAAAAQEKAHLSLSRSIGVETRAHIALSQAAEQEERVRTQQTRTLVNEERARNQATRSVTNEAEARRATAQAVLAEQRIKANAERDEDRRRRKEAADKRGIAGKVQDALMSTRYTLPGSGGKIQPLVGRTLQAVGVDTKDPRALAAAAGIAGLSIAGQGLQKAYTAAADFDQALRQVNTSAHLTDAGLKDLGNQVLTLAKDKDIRQGPADLATALYDIYSSGFEGAKGMDILTQAARGASAGMTTTSTASGVLMSSLQSGVKGVTSAEQAMDVLFKTVEIGRGNFENLASALPNVLSTAGKFGVSLQEIGAFLATASLQGQSFEEASTDLLNILNKLVDPPKEARPYYEKLGIAYGASALQASGLSGKLQEIVKKTNGNADAIKQLLPDMQAYRGILSGSVNDGQKYNAILDELSDKQKVAGATSKALAEQNKGAKAEMEKLRQEFEIMAVEIGPVAIKTLRDLFTAGRPLLDILHDMAEAFSNLTPEQQQWVAGLAVATAAGGTITNAVLQIKELATVLGGLKNLGVVGLTVAVAYVAYKLGEPAGKALAEAVGKNKDAQMERYNGNSVQEEAKTVVPYLKQLRDSIIHPEKYPQGVLPTSEAGIRARQALDQATAADMKKRPPETKEEADKIFLTNLDRLMKTYVNQLNRKVDPKAVAASRAEANKATGIDGFMRAIAAQESGGDANLVNHIGAQGLFQIMPSNWGPWSKETFGKTVPKTAENQTAVARAKMLQYYKEMGSWDAVATAWFAGPDRGRRLAKGDMSVLNIRDTMKNGKPGVSVAEYVNWMRLQRGEDAKYPMQENGPWVKKIRDAEAKRAAGSGAGGNHNTNPFAGWDADAEKKAAAEAERLATQLQNSREQAQVLLAEAAMKDVERTYDLLLDKFKKTGNLGTMARLQEVSSVIASRQRTAAEAELAKADKGQKPAAEAKYTLATKKGGGIDQAFDTRTRELSEALQQVTRQEIEAAKSRLETGRSGLEAERTTLQQRLETVKGATARAVLETAIAQKDSEIAGASRQIAEKELFLDQLSDDIVRSRTAQGTYQRKLADIARDEVARLQQKQQADRQRAQKEAREAADLLDATADQANIAQSLAEGADAQQKALDEAFRARLEAIDGQFGVDATDKGEEEATRRRNAARERATADYIRDNRAIKATRRGENADAAMGGYATAALSGSRGDFDAAGALFDKARAGAKPEEQAALIRQEMQALGTALNMPGSKVDPAQVLTRAEALVETARALKDGNLAELLTALEEIGRGSDISQTLKKASEEARSGLEQANGHLDKRKELLRSLGLENKALNDSQEAIVRSVLKLNAELEHTVRIQAKIGEVMSGVEGVFNDAFSNMLDGTNSFFDDILKGFSNLIKRMAAQELAGEAARVIRRTVNGFFHPDSKDGKKTGTNGTGNGGNGSTVISGTPGEMEGAGGGISGVVGAVSTVAGILGLGGKGGAGGGRNGGLGFMPGGAGQPVPVFVVGMAPGAMMGGIPGMPGIPGLGGLGGFGGLLGKAMPYVGLAQMADKFLLKGALSKGIGKLFGGLFADGGTLAAGRWGIVGEQGPEIVWSGGSPLSVLNNSRSKAAMAGGLAGLLSHSAPHAAKPRVPSFVGGGSDTSGTGGKGKAGLGSLAGGKVQQNINQTIYGGVHNAADVDDLKRGIVEAGTVLAENP
jgi:TP901 family phage tail tape measure protein